MIMFIYVACVSIGIALDWAILGRVALYTESIGGTKPKSTYKKILFPRMIVTICGLALISYSVDHNGAHNITLWLGLTLFFLSIFYSIVRSYRS